MRILLRDHMPQCRVGVCSFRGSKLVVLEPIKAGLGLHKKQNVDWQLQAVARSSVDKPWQIGATPFSAITVFLTITNAATVYVF